MSALEDRRQRAREAFYDAMGAGDVIEVSAVEAVIETATRVKITPEVLATIPRGSVHLDDMMRINLLHQAFKAAGFEVEL